MRATFKGNVVLTDIDFNYATSSLQSSVRKHEKEIEEWGEDSGNSAALLAQSRKTLRKLERAREASFRKTVGDKRYREIKRQTAELVKMALTQ